MNSTLEVMENQNLVSIDGFSVVLAILNAMREGNVQEIDKINVIVSY